MTFWPLTNSDFPTYQTFNQFHDLYTELDIHRIMSGFHGAFATGVASQQGTLTLPDTWFRPPFWDLLMLQLLRPNSSNLPCLYSTFHLEYPLVLSRFCFDYLSCVALISYAADDTVHKCRRFAFEVCEITRHPIMSMFFRYLGAHQYTLSNAVCNQDIDQYKIKLQGPTFFWWIISGNRGFFFRTMSDIFPFLSLLVGLSTNFMTWYRLWPLPNYEWFPWSICNGCDMPAGNAFPSGHLVPSPILGLACPSIVETRFLELAMSLLNFSPRIPIGTFSIFLFRKKRHTVVYYVSALVGC